MQNIAEDSPEDLSRGSTPERGVRSAPSQSPQARALGSLTPHAGVLNIPSVRPRQPPPAHRGSPSPASFKRISPEKILAHGGKSTPVSMSGSPGLAPLEQLTAGIGNMPPPLAKGSSPSPPITPRPAHSTKPMPPLLHVPSGRISGPPTPLQVPPPPRLTPASTRVQADQGAQPLRQAPPLQRAPSPVQSGNTATQRQPLRAPAGRGNPSVAVIHPMPPPPPPTPPERASPIEAGDFEDEEEAKRAFSVFNIGPNRMRAPAPQTVSPAAAHATPRTSQASTRGVDVDYTQFNIRPALRRATPTSQTTPAPPRYASGGYTSPFLSGAPTSMTGSIPQRPPPPYPGTSRISHTTTNIAGISVQQFLCPYCPYEGGNTQALKNHILSHQPNIQWVCPYCPGPTRMTKVEVETHMRSEHPACQIVYIPYGVPI